MRKIISISLGILVIVLAVFSYYTMVNKNKKEKRKAPKIIKTVFVETVQNKDVPIIITANGNLVAKNKIELFSEVQGILKPLSKDFKAGTTYRKGEVILKINSEEHYANLQAQKSNLFNSITSIMPDIRLDYPEEYDKWQKYLKSFDFNKTTPALPQTNSEKEKFFISGRNIYTTYYNVRNMEVRLSKYTIRAPYNGILTETFVNPGTLVRQGQKLGEFIDPRVYEMEIAISATYRDLLQKGKKVELHNLENTQSWTGKVIRVNGKIDQASQTIKVFIQINSQDLKEGMYLEADLLAKSEKDAYEITRKVLVNNNSVYIVNDTVLKLVPVQPVYFKDQTVIIKGLADGSKTLSRIVPGAYDGMLVKIHEETEKKKK
ncbi:MAG: HlyD family efflux transporter periplasmic adaptor subunit [Flavobacteriaceae bacterium]|nr:HlyD family efflux transporter periplasmic adaptor subunit [Flavobacteriaceae bacterium]